MRSVARPASRYDLSDSLVSHRSAEDLFAGWRAEIEALGAVPRLLVWDGEGAVGRRRAGRTELTAECQAFRRRVIPQHLASMRPRRFLPRSLRGVTIECPSGDRFNEAAAIFAAESRILRKPSSSKL